MPLLCYLLSSVLFSLTKMIMLNITNHKGLLEYHPEFVLINESAEAPVSFCPDRKFSWIIISTVGDRPPGRQLSS